MEKEEVLKKIHRFNRFGSRLGLERMGKLMDLLGNPQDKMKVIHVAGTNGKGSVSRYIYSALQENGYRTGLYTSPYLQHFTERIEFNGKLISMEELSDSAEIVFQKVDQMIEEGFESPTEFELVTAIAFHYFSTVEMDYLILEVGLGGRGDSTNIIKSSLISIITSISFDHMEQLGDTLEKIASEKAGIIKNDGIVVSGVKDSGAVNAIRNVCIEKKAHLFQVMQGTLDNIKTDVGRYTFDFKIFNKSFSKVQISMMGMHQIENAASALTALEVLRQKKDVSLTDDAIYNGLLKAKQIGRFEILANDPTIIIDGAHNEDGAQALCQTVLRHFGKEKKWVVLGLLKDKKIDSIINTIAAMSDEIIATEPDNERKLDSDLLCDMIMSHGCNCISMPDCIEAIKYVESKANREDVIIFAGSLYLIGKIRSYYLGNRVQGTGDTSIEI